MATTKTKLAVAAVLAAALVSVPLAVKRFTHRTSPARDVVDSQPNSVPESVYRTIGAATPEAGLRRLVAASQNDDISSAITFLSWQRGDNVPQETADQLKLNDSFTRETTRRLSDVASIRIVNQKAENDAAVRTRVGSVAPNGKVQLAELRLVREGDEWKPAVNITRSKTGSFGVTFFLPLSPELGPVNQ